jgi:quercetin dioxygenase-like cupin family protein
MADNQNTYQYASWNTVPVEAPAAGIERRMVVGNGLMICRLRFDPHVVTAIHRHPHEQMTLVERGRVRFYIEDDERIAGPGDVLHFPSNIRHGATMLDDEVVLVDIFTPIREDFLPSKA